MFRRLSLVAVAAAALIAACGGPAAPTLTDPKEILVKTVEALEEVKTVTFKADISGQIPLDLTGQGSSGSFDLKGTTLEGQIDIEGKKFKASFGIPALLNTSGEIIVLGDDSYVKLGGLFGMGDKYMHSKTEGSDAPADLPTDPSAALSELGDALDKLSNAPTLGDQQKCGDKDCYTVTVELSESDLGDLGSATGGMTGDASLEVLVRTNDLRPAKLTLTADAGEEGSLTLALELSDYDGSVSIEAPPADQVTEGSLEDLFPS